MAAAQTGAISSCQGLATSHKSGVCPKGLAERSFLGARCLPQSGRQQWHTASGQQRRIRAAVSTAPDAQVQMVESAGELPLLLRTMKGEKTERPPVWMMRQAGR